MIKITEKDGIKIGEFKNPTRFTLAISEDVKTQLKPLLNIPETKFIFDLNSVDFIDSSGIGCIISLQNTAKQNNSRFSICNITSNNMKIFELLNLPKILDIHADLDSALNHF